MRTLSEKMFELRDRLASKTDFTEDALLEEYACAVKYMEEKVQAQPLTDEDLKNAAVEVTQLMWTKPRASDAYKWLLNYLKYWRDIGGIAFRRNPLPDQPELPAIATPR